MNKRSVINLVVSFILVSVLLVAAFLNARNYSVIIFLLLGSVLIGNRKLMEPLAFL